MSGRLEFQTQLASIMEVLANAAVAEICKLVDDDYAVVSLQMSQCQRENKGLKRKLNLLELKMARGYAERRLRESAMNSRPNSRVHINTNDKFRESSLSTGGVYNIQLDPMGMWSGGPVANNDHNNSSQMHPNPIRDKSPDLQLVEPESLLVKEERMEDPLGDAEADDVTLIGEDGVVECGPRGGRGRTGAEDTPSHPPTSAHGPEQLSQPQHPEQQQQGPRNRHRVEVSGSAPLLKSDSEPQHAGLLHQPHPAEFDMFGGDDDRGDVLGPLGSFFNESNQAETAGAGQPSCSYSTVAEAAASFQSRHRRQLSLPASVTIHRHLPGKREEVLNVDEEEEEEGKEPPEKWGRDSGMSAMFGGGGRFQGNHGSMAAPSQSRSINDIAMPSTSDANGWAHGGGGRNTGGGNTGFPLTRDGKSAAVEDRDPDIVLIKVEDLDPQGGGLSIQEGLEESTRDNYRGGALPLEATHHTSPSDHTHHHPGTTRHHTTEFAAPESTPSTLRLGQNLGSITPTGGPDLTAECTVESSRPTLPAPASQKGIGTTSPTASLGNTANVPKGAPDNTPPTQTTQQLSKQRAANTQGSEYSLFELETFFTRWAPDTSASTAPSGGPSCSYTDDTTDTDPDCLIVDPEPHPQLPSATVRPTGEGVPFSGHQGVQAATLGVGGAIQGHPTWSRAAILRASQQAHQRQLQRRLRAQQLQQTHPENPTTSTTNTTSTGMSSQSLHSLVGLPPGRGATAKGFAHIEVTLAGQQAAQLAQQHCDAAGRRKSYVCRACGKAFTGQSNLEAHQRVHTGEKPFRCATCGKMFSEAGNLKKHQRVHTGEKPFACSHCGKCFAWICNLKTHQQSVCGGGGGGV
ncbi:hypothetical protein J4Q44_G00041380 [Coregonus suidteri]|uniref:C2H2-type domain-containing protein n=1 Tax=Coregonus suidteri TaxID=861788 RepID=A0AAN8NCQ6_9TELE